MVEPRNGLALLEPLGERPLAAPKRARKLFRKRLVLAELGEQRLVLQVGNVLGIVERRRGGRALVGLFLVGRLTGVDAWSMEGMSYALPPASCAGPTLENTQPTEVAQRDLQTLHCLTSGRVVFSCTLGVPLLDLGHGGCIRCCRVMRITLNAASNCDGGPRVGARSKENMWSRVKAAAIDARSE